MGKFCRIPRVIRLFDYVVEDGDLLEFLLLVLPRVCFLLETGPVLEDFLCLFLIVPEILLGYCDVECFDLLLDGSDVKDTLEGFPSSVPELLFGF